MSFEQFLRIFPEVKLPVSINENSAAEFDRENDPFSERMITEYILPLEEDADEYTEFIPGFRIAGLKEFHAVLYWKAGLMNYQYILATFEKGGKFIDRKVIAGTVSDGNVITRSVARIDDDMTIYIVSGQVEGSQEYYQAGDSTARELELLPDGRMIEFA
jgi:hypothetical protein